MKPVHSGVEPTAVNDQQTDIEDCGEGSMDIAEVMETPCPSPVRTLPSRPPPWPLTFNRPGFAEGRLL
jgi:hypothetical protein